MWRLMHNRYRNNQSQLFFDSIMSSSNFALSGRIKHSIQVIRNFLFSHDQLILLVIILGMSLAYKYPETLLKRPQSVHSWRQCDGASLALHYYQNGMHFFKPGTQGLYSDHETAGLASPSEFPVLYYFVACLYKIFGYHEYIFRGTNLLFFFVGLFYLYKLSRILLQDKFHASVIVILLFSSPLIVYYANNFLPNSVALSFTIAGWYYFYLYLLQSRTRTFLLSMLLFGIAGAMKITELSGPIIILFLMLADRMNLLRLNLNARKDFVIKIGALAGIFILISAWILYAKWYNNIHLSSTFSTNTYPLWKMSCIQMKTVIHKIHVNWLTDYYWKPTLYVLLVCLLVISILYKKTNQIMALATLLYTLGLVGFSVLWFEALGEHDYFFTGFFILPVFIFINGFLLLEKIQMKPWFRRSVNVLIITFLIFNIIHARNRQEFRYKSWMNDYRDMQDLYQAVPYLRSIHINPMDTVVYYGSLNIRPLYLMNLNGWTLRDNSSTIPEVERHDSMLMKQYINTGAKYLITNNINALANHRSLRPYTHTLKGKFNGIYIFSIPPGRQNFELSESLHTIISLRCDMEKSGKNQSYYYYNDSIHRANAGGIPSYRLSHSGSKSLMLTSDKQYGMVTRLKVQPNDRVTLSVYQYPLDSACYLVMSSTESRFYKSQHTLVRTEKSGWRKISCTLDIPASIGQDSLVTYFLNSGKKEVFIDDFEINVERRDFHIINPNQ
jgi:hypothetical protein